MKILVQTCALASEIATCAQESHNLFALAMLVFSTFHLLTEIGRSLEPVTASPEDLDDLVLENPV